MAKHSVLFICLGNICRSPIAEAVFLQLLKEKGLEDQWEVDSAAVIDYHLGKGPDKRTMDTLRQNGIEDYSHKVRQVTHKDFDRFEYIFGMDDDNIGDLESLQSKNPKASAKLELLGAYDPQGNRIVPDPYYESDDSMFGTVFKQCQRCCQAFLEKVHGK